MFGLLCPMVAVLNVSLKEVQSEMALSDTTEYNSTKFYLHTVLVPICQNIIPVKFSSHACV